MSATPEIIQQARSSDPDARQKAAWAVSHAAEERDYALMFELLGDKDWRVRKTIVDGFVRDPQPEVVTGLLEALGDADNAGKRNSATEGLVRVGAAAIAPIVVRLRTESDIDVRLSLVNLLGDLRSGEGFDMLLEMLDREHDINLASSIVSSLGKYRDAAALPTLLRVLRREDLWLKFHAIEALGLLHDLRLAGVGDAHERAQRRQGQLLLLGDDAAEERHGADVGDLPDGLEHRLAQRLLGVKRQDGRQRRAVADLAERLDGVELQPEVLAPQNAQQRRERGGVAVFAER